MSNRRELENNFCVVKVAVVQRINSFFNKPVVTNILDLKYIAVSLILPLWESK